MTDFAVARQNMVESQIRTNKVLSGPLLDAMRAVPRETFVPAQQRTYAYVDEDLPLGNGRYLMEPMVLARLIEAANVEPDDIILDIGCATGYSTALLAHLGETVVGLDSDKELAERANEALTGLGIGNAAVVAGDMTEGYPKQAPYNVIIFNGAIERVPDRLGTQLAEGGRMLAVIRGRKGLGEARLMLKSGGNVSGRPLFDAATPFLPGFEPADSFVF